MNYPFAALVGLDSLKTALVLSAIDPGVGGVLIRGEKGTAKSTAARALVDILPPLRRAAKCPFNCDPEAPWSECPDCATGIEAATAPVPLVTLPLGATEDRVLGTLDFEKALREGRRAFQPGLLASAHRGILYIDEVNLLADHLVDVLLDAAAMGTNTVQREGVSVVHPARFTLIGTMNPEEGDLRPQFLDRFGLMVTIESPRDPAVRREVVRRRLDFDRDPADFAARWSGEQAELRDRIAAARTRLPGVTIDEPIATAIATLCCERGIESLRADLVVHKGARAHAAWRNRDHVTDDDVRIAAELALPHRRRRRSFEPPSRRPSDAPMSSSPPSDGAAQDALADAETVVSPMAGLAAPKVDIAPERPGPRPAVGRRNLAPSDRGRYVRAVRDTQPASVAIDATLRSAALAGLDADGRPRVTASDLHRKERVGPSGTLIVFVVDASGSMAARKRMELVKGTVLALLGDAYVERNQVAVVAFRGIAADELLPPTAATAVAQERLAALPTGGRTPLAHGFEMAERILERSKRSDPDRSPFLVLLSDGKANVPLPATNGDPREQALDAARRLAGVPALVIDADDGYIPSGRVRELAAALQAESVPLRDVTAETLSLTIRERRRSSGGGS
jgi:magnesium chelatase subunit D